MDLREILSPHDTPVSTPSSQHQPPLHPPPKPNNHALTKRPNGSSQPSRPVPERQSSSNMDMLADLAAMQQHQAAVRSSTNSLRNPDLQQSPLNSPSISSNAPNGSFPNTPTRARSVSNLISRPLEQTQRQTPLATPMSEGDLPIMEQPVLIGEQAWVQKLYRAIFSASSVQDRISVMELCVQAVGEEAYSPKLWQIYGDWMWYLYKNSHGVQGVYENSGLDREEYHGRTLEEQVWTEDDILIGREVFHWQPVLDTWRQGIDAVQWHVDLSHNVWDPYLELRVHDLQVSPAPAKVQEVTQLFLERLQQPHSTWDNTSSMFSTFVSHHDQGNYSHLMADVERKRKEYQIFYNSRQKREIELVRVAATGDTTSEREMFEEYLEWEEKQSQHNKTHRQLVRNLYVALRQRAALRFPKDTDFWMDFVTFFMQPNEDKQALLENAERATKRCPDSGELWATRLYAMEACDRPYKEIETVKHHATSSGQLEDSGNMEELIKVDFAWCSYLRRNAFSSKNSSGDARDVAEVAIRSAIENVARVGRDKFGDAFRGDPEFRVERIYLKFLAQAGQYEDARVLFKRLEPTHGDSHFFWERWYLWEMTVWESTRDNSVGDKSQSVPSFATAVLKRAIGRPHLDWPEKVIDMYLHHCAQHESAQALVEAQLEGRRNMKKIKKMRAEQAAYAVQNQAQYPSETAETSSGKRARSEEEDDATDVVKRQRRRSSGRKERPEINDPSSPATAQVKRDREHSTVIVQHLPEGVNEHEIRQYFRDCGEITAVRIHVNEASAEAAATVEFASTNDVLTAQTKDMKRFGDKAIDVKVGTGTTLWVTNYPRHADEEYVRDLFGKFGDIVEVRFPSVKYNTHRRFCYVQFLTASQAAQASAALHGQVMEGNHKLSALISDPQKRKERTGASEEGRELYLSNVERSANEAEIQQFMEAEGAEHIEQIRIPRDLKGKSKGTAFVIFRTKEAIDQVVRKMDKLSFKGRILNAKIAQANVGKIQSSTILREQNPSATPEADSTVQGSQNARSPSEDVKMEDYGASAPSGEAEPAQQRPRQRTLALLNVSDTVNDARIAALCNPFGPLVKIILKPENGGALIEFEHTADMNKAAMQLDGVELAGQKLRVGKPWEVMQGAKKSKEVKNSGFPTAKPVSRPIQRGGFNSRGRARARVGLGSTRAVAGGQGADGDGAKGQGDFRAMLNKAREDEEAKAEAE